MAETLVAKASDFSDLLSKMVMIFERADRRKDSLKSDAAGRVGHSVKHIYE